MKKYVNLELSSVLGTGAIGPVLAVLTATLCTSFGSFVKIPNWTYPVVMFFLSGLAAVFPVVKSGYSKMLKAAMWPLATVVIFASAWTSSTGMSMGEDKIRSSSAGQGVPEGVPMAPTSVSLMVDEYNGSGIAGGFFKRVR